RIVMQGITGVNEKIRLKMTILSKGIFCGNSANYILIKDNQYDKKYVLGVLNSKLLNWYFKLFSTNSNVNGYEVDNLPIPSHDRNSRELVSLVENVLHITKDEDYLSNPTKQARVKELERQIDQMVYELYGLTAEEIAVVEGNSEHS
ncbi:MAG: TaqI-like C-terminal specificity domain-containing protein, partial [Dehalococcoidales bacterium]